MPASDADTIEFSGSAGLPVEDLELPPVADTHLPDLYVGLEIDLLAPGDGIVTDRHHASADRYEADDPKNQIGGQIPPFTLSGWLRHGCERVLQTYDTIACHPGNADADYMFADVYERDLEAGYHGQLVGYAGDEPIQTAINGIQRVGTHSKFGFGEFRVWPATDDRVTTLAAKTKEAQSAEQLSGGA